VVELTPLGISVLALLVEAPMHPYEMYQLLRKRRNDRIVKVRPGSLYHTVERLARQGLVEATGTERAGNRPERTTYAVTPEGRRTLETRVVELIETVVYEFPIFPVALSEAHNLTRRDAMVRLTRRADDLDARVEETEQAIEEARSRDVDEAYWIAADYLRVMLAAERDWLRTTIDRLETKDLAWPRRTKS
jgi:DNA-binding PadR family transcriptional regulator